MFEGASPLQLPLVNFLLRARSVCSTPIHLSHTGLHCLTPMSASSTYNNPILWSCTVCSSLIQLFHDVLLLH